MIKEALTFDDVLLQPAESHLGPNEANIETKIDNSINLKIPLISAAMDTVTEHKLAIAMAQLSGGLKSAMGYTGNSTIESMQKNCNFRKITNAGLRESHVHDVIITRESPNYRHS